MCEYVFMSKKENKRWYLQVNPSIPINFENVNKGVTIDNKFRDFIIRRIF